MRHILHKIALSPYTALSPIGPHCVPMGLNPSVVSFFFCSGRRRRLPPRPLCGSDPMQPEGPLAKVISIHAPRVGSDPPGMGTLETVHGHFNPRSPCGERQDGTPKLPKRRAFQSTLPVWGATASGSASPGAADISIHAPRVGSDRGQIEQPGRGHYFNPRSPCGERPSAFMPIAWRNALFQSTLPVWGATDHRLLFL